METRLLVIINPVYFTFFLKKRGEKNKEEESTDLQSNRQVPS